MPDEPADVLETPLVDTHCHLFLMAGEPRDQVAAARAAGVDTLICVGVDAETSRRSSELADSLEGVFATAGVHPNSAEEFDAATGAVIEELLADRRVVAVGETGLDNYRMGAPADVQERVFRAHCGLAREADKPLVVHVRDGWPRAMELMEIERASRVVLHCFSGDEEVAREAAARGYYCSFAGNVTYPPNTHLREAAAALPEELLLVETDSPFLSPHGMRGKDNAPGNVRHAVATIAAARGVSAEAVAVATSRNARAAFGLPAT